MVVRKDEVWHFPQSSDTLFSGYVKMFLKYEPEASCYPMLAVSEADKNACVKKYFVKENIRLNPDQICVN